MLLVSTYRYRYRVATCTCNGTEAIRLKDSYRGNPGNIKLDCPLSDNANSVTPVCSIGINSIIGLLIK